MNRIHVDLSLANPPSTVNSVLLKSFHGFAAMSQDGNSEAYQKFLEGIWRFPEIGVPQIIHFIFGGSNINHLFLGYPHWWNPPYHIPCWKGTQKRFAPFLPHLSLPDMSRLLLWKKSTSGLRAEATWKRRCGNVWYIHEIFPPKMVM